MWLIYDAETGDELRRSATLPELGEGEGAERMPASGLSDPPASIWSPAARGFVDVVEVTGPRLFELLTMAEITAAAASTDEGVRSVLLTWLLLLAGGRPQRVNSPLHQAGAAALLADGILTPERHAQFVAGEPVQIA